MLPVQQKALGVHDLVQFLGDGLGLLRRLAGGLLVGVELEHEPLEGLGDFVVRAGAMFEAEELVGILERLALGREEGHDD